MLKCVAFLRNTTYKDTNLWGNCSEILKKKHFPNQEHLILNRLLLQMRFFVQCGNPNIRNKAHQ